MDDPERFAVAVFARTPELDVTKTRLGPALGAAGALRAHRELVEHSLAQLSALEQADVSLWVTRKDTATRAWADQYGFALHQQQGADLGARMAHALSSLFAFGARSACVVGTDCPTIDAAYLESARAALLEAPVVIGPAEDGGYGLIGMRARHGELFREIDWGTSGVRAQTLARACELGLHVVQLTSIWDVDEPADWQRYQRWKRKRRSG